MVFKRARGPILIGLVTVCAAFSFRQVGIMREMRSLRVEVARIIVHVEQYHAEHGQYPVALVDYDFEQIGHRNEIEYKLRGNSYEIWFNPTGERTYGHYYFPTYGYVFEDD